MNRTWAYLAALLPFTTAVSPVAMGSGGLIDGASGRIARPKSDSEEDGKKPSDSLAPDEDGGIGIETPNAASGEVGDAYDDDDLPAMFDAGEPGAAFLIHPQEGMYAPAHIGSGGANPTQILSGGVSVGTIVPSGTGTQAGPPPSGTDDQGEGDPDTGVVEPDPADADAMLVLLGGLASGSGTGATSSGEIVFDMVDYGLVTVGYGFATFMAAGSDGATADTFAGIEGADLAFSFTTNDWRDDSAASTTYVLAIDFEGDLVAGDPAIGDVNWKELMGQDPFFQWLGGQAEEDVSVNGNIALGSFSGEVPTDDGPLLGSGTTLAVDELGSFVTAWLQSDQASLNVQAESHGIDTLVLAGGGLLEIEDHFSSVNGSVTAVG